jgi:hypothetical protein
MVTSACNTVAVRLLLIVSHRKHALGIKYICTGLLMHVPGRHSRPEAESLRQEKWQEQSAFGCGLDSRVERSSGRRNVPRRANAWRTSTAREAVPEQADRIMEVERKGLKTG